MKKVTKRSNRKVKNVAFTEAGAARLEQLDSLCHERITLVNRPKRVKTFRAARGSGITLELWSETRKFYPDVAFTIKVVDWPSMTKAERISESDVMPLIELLAKVKAWIDRQRYWMSFHVENKEVFDRVIAHVVKEHPPVVTKT